MLHFLNRLRRAGDPDLNGPGPNGSAWQRSKTGSGDNRAAVGSPYGDSIRGPRCGVTAISDSSMRVLLSADRLTAHLAGRAPADRNEGAIRHLLAETISKSKVNQGLEHFRLSRAVELLLEGGELNNFLLAKGTPPQPGRDGRVEYLIDLDGPNAGRARDNGHIDFRDRGGLPLAKPGQALARLIEPIPGRPGTDVLGKPIKPPLPRRPRFLAGKNVVRRDNELVAEAEGRVVELARGKLAVLQVLDLEQIDYQSGHVEFPGLVRVRNRIAGGFHLTAEAAAVESLEPGAKVTVAESLTVAFGVMGAEVDAGGSVTAGLVRKSLIKSGENVRVGSEIVDSEISAQGAVEVVNAGGRIVNSKIKAGGRVEATDVITSSKGACEISLGLTERVGEADRSETEQAWETWRESAEKLILVKKRLEKLIKEDPGFDRADPPEPIRRLIQAYRRLKEEEGLAQMKATALESQGRTEESKGAVLRVTGRAGPGLTIKGRWSGLVLDREEKSITVRETSRRDPTSGRTTRLIAIYDLSGRKMLQDSPAPEPEKPDPAK